MKVNKPSIILVKPQLPENIGMVARAMDNCGFENLILVNPREIWPNQISLKVSANSKNIIDKTKIFNSLSEALLTFNFVIATSNRKRFLRKPHLNNFSDLFDRFPIKKKSAIIFGPENSGLSNEDLSLCDIIFNINTSNSNNSLNLSHAVLLMSFHWRNFFILNKKELKQNSLHNQQAPKKDFINFMNYLRFQLDDVGFLYPKNKSKSMFENIQSMFLRSSLSKTEIHTLWGMIKKLRK